MKLGVMFSGGKDSTYALFKAMNKEDVVCLISLISKNKESYMFHTPNINLVDIQAKSIGLPLIKKETSGKKEEELKDMKAAIKTAIKKFKIDGIVTGGIESVYQSKRFQKICNELDIWCFNPIWLINQESLLKELIKNKFKIIISGVFAEAFNEQWLGKIINENTIKELIELNKKYRISISGEGGEIETTVLDAPIFKKRIEIKDSEKKTDENSGIFVIKKVKLVRK